MTLFRHLLLSALPPAMNTKSMVRDTWFRMIPSAAGVHSLTADGRAIVFELVKVKVKLTNYTACQTISG